MTATVETNPEETSIEYDPQSGRGPWRQVFIAGRPGARWWIGKRGSDPWLGETILQGLLAGSDPVILEIEQKDFPVLVRVLGAGVSYEMEVIWDEGGKLA